MERRLVSAFVASTAAVTLGTTACVSTPKPDTTPPALSLPADITVTAQNPSGATVLWTATAVDEIDGPVPVTCTPASGSVLPVGTTPVDCSASDAANNTATDSFTVTVTSCSPDATSITAGDQHTCALFDNGTARCWGTVGFEDYVGHHWQRLRRDDHLMRHASGALYRRGWPELN